MNLFYNPGFQSWQNNRDLPNMAHRTPTADGVLFGTDGAGAQFRGLRSSDTPDSSVPWSVHVECTTAGGIGSTSERHLRFVADGRKLFPLRGQNLPHRFWIKRSRSGVQSFAFPNKARTRTWLTEVVINAPHVWQEVSFCYPFASADYSQFDFEDFGYSMRVSFGGGSQYQAAPNQWHNGNFTCTPNQTNLGEYAGDYLKISKVQMGNGDEAFSLPDFALVEAEALSEIRVFRQDGSGVNIIGHGAWAGSSAPGDNGTINFDICLPRYMRKNPDVFFLGQYGTDYEIQYIHNGAAVPGIVQIEGFPRSPDVLKFTAYKAGGGITPGQAYVFRLKTAAAGLGANGAYA